MDSVLNADVVCWATPIYYYEMSGQMKTLIDRMNAMYPKDYRFRDIYLLTTVAESEENTPKRAESGLQGWIDCYEKSALKAQPIFSAAESMIRGKSTGIPNSRRRLNWGRTFSLVHSASSLSSPLHKPRQSWMIAGVLLRNSHRNRLFSEI